MPLLKYEADIEAKTCSRVLHELCVFSIKIKSAQENGYPDREFLIPGGRPLFIEFKRPGEEPTDYQQMIHKRLRHAGYDVEVHTAVEEAFRAVEARLRAANGGKVACPE